MLIKTNSKPQNSDVKYPFRIVQTLSNQRKASGMNKDYLLSFVLEIFIFRNPLELPSTHHYVDKELEEVQEGIHHQDINCHIS